MELDLLLDFRLEGAGQLAAAMIYNFICEILTFLINSEVSKAAKYFNNHIVLKLGFHQIEKLLEFFLTPNFVNHHFNFSTDRYLLVSQIALKAQLHLNLELHCTII